MASGPSRRGPPPPRPSYRGADSGGDGRARSPRRSPPPPPIPSPRRPGRGRRAAARVRPPPLASSVLARLPPTCLRAAARLSAALSDLLASLGDGLDDLGGALPPPYGGSGPANRARRRAAASALACAALVTSLAPLVLLWRLGGAGGGASGGWGGPARPPRGPRGRPVVGVRGGWRAGSEIRRRRRDRARLAAAARGRRGWGEDPPPVAVPSAAAAGGAGGFTFPSPSGEVGPPPRERKRKKKKKKDEDEDKDSDEDSDDDERGDGSGASDPDYGGLDIRFLASEQRRQIYRSPEGGDGVHDHVFTSGDFEDDNDDWVDPYYAMDDDAVRHKRCRRTSWHRDLRVNCNEFHSVGVLGEGNRYISHGYFRDVFILRDPADRRYVLKSLRIKPKGHKVSRASMETTRMDALVMNKLGRSPRIVDGYGHCGTSVLTEALAREAEKAIEPGRGYASQREVDLNFGPRNNLTTTEKLTMALGMAEALADLHGYEGGVIVHDDIQLSQFLWDEGGTLKLNDFNRAEVMLWDENREDYCRYKNGGGYGNYRAPEEWADEPLNEKIDVYSFGNIVYGLLTGLEPFYTNEDDTVVQKRMGTGETPFIDERYRTRSYAEAKLTTLLDMCWIFDPDKRASIFEVVAFLRDAVEENSKLQEESSGHDKKEKV